MLTYEGGAYAEACGGVGGGGGAEGGGGAASGGRGEGGRGGGSGVGGSVEGGGGVTLWGQRDRVIAYNPSKGLDVANSILAAYL